MPGKKEVLPTIMLITWEFTECQLILKGIVTSEYTEKVQFLV